MQLMKNFHRLGVRDMNTFKFAESLNHNTPTLVLDPTLIYNFDTEVKELEIIFFFILTVFYLMIGLWKI